MATGDLAVEPGTVVIGHPDGDMRAYVGSLRRLHARNPAAVYPGHGDPIETPRETFRRLIDHRRDREARVLAAVREGAQSVEAITDAAYEKDISDVRRLAEATVRAHLEKLATEHEVNWAGGDAEPQ
jgi:glyoxylase-like metal-dependent hydrolase (beta-lactamase superfamily II)